MSEENNIDNVGDQNPLLTRVKEGLYDENIVAFLGPPNSGKTVIATISTSVAFATHQEIPTIPADQGTVTQTAIPSEEVRLLKSIDAKLGHLENLVKSPEFFLLYSVNDAVIECENTSKDVRLYHHNQKHNNNDDDFFSWTGEIQYGGIKYKESRHTLPFFIYEMELEGDSFSGKGILHGDVSLCAESDNVFEIDITETWA